MQPVANAVQEALMNQASPDFIANMVDGLNALFEHVYTEHEMEVLNACDENPDAEMMENIHDLIFKALIDVCGIHRVTVNEENATVGSLAKFVRSLLLMQYWGDRDSILDLCMSDAGLEDRLSAISALVGEMTQLQANDLIGEVDPNFIRGLIRLYTDDGMSPEEDTFEIDPAQLDKLRQWRSVMRAERSLAYRMVKAGYKPGYAFEEYIKRVLGTFAQSDNRNIATEIVPFLLMGRDTWTNVLKGWRDNSHLLNLELQDITEIDTLVVKNLGEFDILSKHQQKTAAIPA